MTKNKESTRFYSANHEARVAQKLQGRVVSNSGATQFHKGDVVLDDWLIECKTTETPKTSYSIKLAELKKNEQEAFAMGKYFSALAFDFGQKKDYVVIRLSDLQELLAGYTLSK
jgi:hypothetical protein